MRVRAAQVAHPIVIGLWDWNRLNTNELVGEVRVLPDQLAGVLRNEVGWQEEREWPVIDPKGAKEKTQVRGHDNELAVLVLKMRVMEATPEQLRAAAAAHEPTKLGAASQSAVPPPPPVKGPGKLEVTIVQGLHLPKTDTIGSIDAYCELSFGEQGVKTDVIKNDLSPHWSKTTTLNVEDKSRVGSLCCGNLVMCVRGAARGPRAEDN